MPRFGLATLNHSPLHGLPSQWENHLEAAASAGFDALAPDVFWLRALEKEGVTLERISAAMRSRGLACMEIAGLAVGSEELTARELEENVRYARALSAEFVNTRIVEKIDAAVIERVKASAIALREKGAQNGGTRVALEFSRGSKLNSLAAGSALVEAVEEEGIGVTLDTWHFFLHPEGPDWAGLESLDLGDLANVQLSDGVPYGEGEFGEATMNRRCLPGRGEFDLSRCAGMLGQRGFDGAVILEVLNAEERERPLTDYARDCLESAREKFRIEPPG